MFDPTAMILADKATKHHVLSARPKARTTPDRPPRQRAESMRLRAATALRRLADRVEPRRAKTCVPAA
ncbi:hypothetical protein [Phytohabitans kaempferiae]|uniref:Uncharacterized protein n=1 Tax=Phytohabitans kaempferiae TaxID=1620943 RepID=A0ABV6M4E9_9ACTN